MLTGRRAGSDGVALRAETRSANDAQNWKGQRKEWKTTSAGGEEQVDSEVVNGALHKEPAPVAQQCAPITPRIAKHHPPRHCDPIRTRTTTTPTDRYDTLNLRHKA